MGGQLLKSPSTTEELCHQVGDRSALYGLFASSLQFQVTHAKQVPARRGNISTVVGQSLQEFGDEPLISGQ